MTNEILIEEIKRHEDFRSQPYRDTEGILTIGYGYNPEKGMSEAVASKLLEWELAEVVSSLKRVMPFWKVITAARQEVFINMGYNLGVPRFLGFKKMLAAAAAGDVTGVCREMRDSRWARQVGRRAEELIEKYRRG